MIDNFGLYFITGTKLSREGNIADVKAAIAGGVKIIQYRDKEKSDGEFKKEALEIKRMCNENNVIFIINDRVDIAKEIDADGVHIGIEDMPLQEARRLLPNKIIGVTVHNVDGAVGAEQQGADYLGVSPIFKTQTKTDAGKPAGIELIKDVKEKAEVPIVAIGGINENNLIKLLNAGCYNVAMISAIVTKDDVEKAVREINDTIAKSAKE